MKRNEKPDSGRSERVGCGRGVAQSERGEVGCRSINDEARMASPGLVVALRRLRLSLARRA